MAEYSSVEEARKQSGMRVVCAPGIPGLGCTLAPDDAGILRCWLAAIDFDFRASKRLG